MHALRVLVAAMAVALLAPALAGAQAYPKPGDPNTGPSPTRGTADTLHVCKRGCDYRRIQAAVNDADGKDTIKIHPGRYSEGVKIFGKRYDGLKVIGKPKRPSRVKLDGKGLRGAAAQNAFFVNKADGVTINGIHARRYKANCFFVTNANGYLLTNLVGEQCGNYGMYAFNSKGGEMSHSEAYYNPDSGFYVGQTPPQRGRKKRTILKDVDSWGNVLGFSGTNMRYVTITKSRFYNNGAGIVPNALSSEKFPPPDENVISNNEVFWNNFNFYAGAPFDIPKSSAADLPYPVGIGVLLFGSQDTLVERNKFYGNYLGGFAEIQAVQLAGNADPKLNEASILRNNVVRNNVFGKGGNDLNGRDMVYDGSGTGNCFQDNVVLSPNLPEDNSTFAPCPGPAQNTFNQAALIEAISFASGSPDDPASFEAKWIKHPHAAKAGFKPLEHWTK
ncbi:MAG: hypothetical protein H0U41_05295 [Actinobacteria bacterium]|nr:hypothetical protein [Actinomycetota bacterium]